jgi:hypothetical protein
MLQSLISQKTIQDIEMNSLAATESRSLPCDMIGELLSASSQDLLAVVSLACVNKHFNAYVRKWAAKHPPTACFGQKQWHKFGADVGEVPPIPLKFYHHLATDNFLCTYIPATINGTVMTLNSFDAFIMELKHQKHSNYRCSVAPMECESNEYPLQKPFKKRWVLLSKNISKDTTCKTFEDQQKLVDAKGYTVPNLTDVVVSILMHQLNTGEYIFSLKNDPDLRLNYTRVKDHKKEQLRSIVGCYHNNILCIISYRPDCDCSLMGTAYALTS